ncbi:MAG: hypothetical protein R2873_22435 [Caldilineaceae bacterium]
MPVSLKLKRRLSTRRQLDVSFASAAALRTLTVGKFTYEHLLAQCLDDVPAEHNISLAFDHHVHAICLIARLEDGVTGRNTSALVSLRNKDARSSEVSLQMRDID